MSLPYPNSTPYPSDGAGASAPPPGAPGGGGGGNDNGGDPGNGAAGAAQAEAVPVKAEVADTIPMDGSAVNASAPPSVAVATAMPEGPASGSHPLLQGDVVGATPVHGQGIEMGSIQQQQVNQAPMGIPGAAAPSAPPQQPGNGKEGAFVTPSATATVVPGATVAEAYPVALSDGEITQMYAQQGWDTSKINAIPVATAEEQVPNGQFFTAQEMQTLNAQPIPYAVNYDTLTAAPPPQPQNFVAAPQVVLAPSGGALPIMMGAYCPAVVKRESMKKGLVSRDPVLDNRDMILKFFNMHGVTRPFFWIGVEGYHHETRTRTSRDANGNTTTHTETHKVVDFYYRVNLTDFIYPYGKITTVDGSTVESMIDSYLEDTNSLKSLQLKKKVYWNTRALTYLVYEYIRGLGWHRGLNVYPHTDNKSVRVAVDSKRARCWDNCCGRTMMILTIIPALVFCIYGSGHRERGMRSIFTINYHPIQVFEMIRPQLWAPCYRMGCHIS